MLESRPPLFVRARALTGFIELVSKLGGNAETLLRELDIPCRVLDTPEETLLIDQMAYLLEIAGDTLGTPDFGLQLANYQDVSVLGPVALIVRHCATVDEALKSLSRHMSYHSPAARLSMEPDERPGYIRVIYEVIVDKAAPRRHMVELSYAISYRFLRHITGDAGENWCVKFRHSPHPNFNGYGATFDCPIIFKQPIDALIVPASLLQVTIGTGDEVLKKAAERFVSNLIRRFPLDIGRQVEALAEQQLASGVCNLKHISNQLGMHERTLQRRLSAQGIYFEDVVDQIRLKRAKEYLPYEAIPLTQVAAMLGYSEQSSFIRACKRWFDATPMEIRNRKTR